MRISVYLNLLVGLLSIFVVFGCSGSRSDIYSSDAFKLTSTGVKQGNLEATVVSPTEIHSNYFNHPRDIIFKLTINGGDNEQGVGVDHALLLYPTNGKVLLPVIEFGKQFKQTEKDEQKSDFLEPNTTVVFSVDMRGVLKDIREKGFFKAWNGEEIREIKSLAIVGSREPLGWDFSDAHTKPGRAFSDADNDGIFTTELLFNKTEVAGGKRVWRLSTDVSKHPAYTSSLPISESIYNLSLEELEKNKTPDGLFDTGAQWKGVWTRDVSYSILLSLAYLEPEIAKACLRKKVKDGKIVQDTGTGGSWPVSSDRMIWVLAAWEIFSVTGDEAWLREVYPIIKKSFDDDFHTVYSENGLVKGETSFADWREQSYPRWMQPVDIYASDAADNTAVHIRGLEILAEMASFLNEPADEIESRNDQLKQRFNNTFWLPEKGFYAQYLYGQTFPVRSDRAMALAEAFPILFNIAPEERWSQIASSTPISAFGIPTFFPQIPEIPAYHNNSMWPFVQAFWNWSMVKAGHEKGLEAGLAAMFRATLLFLTNKENLRADNGNDYKTEINSDRQLWSVAGQLGMVYRVFLGMEFKPEGISFAPAVPKSFSGSHIVKNFQYRNARLEISVKGFGKSISSFKLDGVAQEKPFFSALLEGNHTIEITLDNEKFDSGSINMQPSTYALETPLVQPDGFKLSWSEISGALHYSIFKNGVKVGESDFPEYEIAPNGTFELWQVRAENAEGFASFLSEPVEVADEEHEFWIEAETQSSRSKRPEKGFNGSGFVEISKTDNRQVDFVLKNLPPGKYRLDFRYSNGNGPINTENKCAIRTLYVDGRETSAVVMPQRGNGAWEDWGFSNAISLTLNGTEKLSLEFKNWNENMNGDVNTALLDAARLLKLD